MTWRIQDNVTDPALFKDLYDSSGGTAIPDAFVGNFIPTYEKLTGKPVDNSAIYDFLRGGALPAIKAGQTDYGSVSSVATDYVTRNYKTIDQSAADTSAKAAQAATSSFLAGFTPYSSLADKGLTPSDAASVVTLEQTLQANQLGLTSTQRAVNGAVIGDINNSSVPGAAGAAGAAAAPIVGTTSPGGKSVYLILGLALLAFFYFRKR